MVTALLFQTKQGYHWIFCNSKFSTGNCSLVYQRTICIRRRHY